jgi:photosystem II stability/assembly factor-like uncharacterized protein
MYRKIALWLVVVLAFTAVSPLHAASAKQPASVAIQSKPTFFASHLRDVLFADGQYVAVGEDGAILHSHNGMDWTIRKSGVKGMLQSVAYGKGTFVAVGDDNVILTSKDGLTWSKRLLVLTDKTVTRMRSTYKPEFASDRVATSTSVLWDGKQFVMHTEFKNYELDGFNEIAHSTFALLSTSPDGVKWTTAQISDHMHESGGRMKFIKGIYYLFTNDGILTSKNLKNWTTLSVNRVQDAAVGPKGYVLGVNIRSVFPDAGYMLVPNLVSTVDTDKAVKLPESGVEGVRSVDYLNGSYIMSMLNGAIAASDNGRDWTISYPFNGDGDTEAELALLHTSSRTALNKTIWDGKQYITVGDHGTIMHSTDLQHFTKGSIAGVTMMAGGDLYGIQYEHGLYYTYGTSGNLLVSRDAANWSEFQSKDEAGKLNRVSSERSIEDAAFNGKDFAVMTNYAYNAMNFTASAFFLPETGSKQSSGDRAYTIAHDVKWNGKAFVARYLDGEVFTYDEATGKWKEGAKGKPANRSVLQASGGGHTIKYTNLRGDENLQPLAGKPTQEQIVRQQWLTALQYLDGSKKWKNSSFSLYSSYELARIGYGLQKNHTPRNQVIKQLIYGNKEFIAVGSGGLILQSKDGKAWKRLDSGTYQSLNGVVWDGKRYLIVGDRGVFLTFS